MSVTPVSYEAEYIEQRSRLTTFFRYLLAIPHFVVAWLWGVAVVVAVVLAWFALLVTGRWPRSLYDFTAAYARYSTYVYAYISLVTDRYPPLSGGADDDYPVRLRVGEPKPRYNRLSVAFRGVLLIPVFIIVYAMQIVYGIGSMLAWFVILVLGRQPRGLQEMIDLGLGYQQRAYAYASLLDDRFPGFGNAPRTLPDGRGAASLPPEPAFPEAPTGWIAPTAPEHDQPPRPGLTGGDPLAG